jgi:hypothetical protein
VSRSVLPGSLLERTPSRVAVFSGRVGITVLDPKRDLLFVEPSSTYSSRSGSTKPSSETYPAPKPKCAQTPQPVAEVMTAVSAAKVTIVVNATSLKLFLFLFLIMFLLPNLRISASRTLACITAVTNEQCLCQTVSESQ